MTFIFTPATRENTYAVIGIAGPTGGGKTWTALELATGLAGPNGKIVLIDTEGKRSLYYADDFRFARYGLPPTYEPQRFIAAWREIAAVKPDVIITDSFSDEYLGEGGLCDMAEEDLPKVKNEAAKWARPKAEHKKVIRWIRNSAPCHLIFSMRAEEKVKLVKVYDEEKRREVTKVEPIGFQPICEKAFMFDMMESFLLTPDRRGVPQWIKPLQQHLPFFPEGQMVTRECGRLLREWCAGGATPKIDARAPAEPAGRRLLDEAYDSARAGSFALRRFWAGLRAAEKRELAASLESDIQAGCPAQLKAIAEQADNKQNPADSSPAGAPSGHSLNPPGPNPEGATSRNPAEYLNA